MAWIDKIPLVILIVVAVILGIAPMNAEPHLIEKSRMLLAWSLVKPIDIFDLIMHGAPSVLLIIRLSRMVIQASKKH